jgi:hypothetical protein
MGASNHDFRKSETRIFLREGLDSPSRIDCVDEISFSAHAHAIAQKQCIRQISKA